MQSLAKYYLRESLSTQKQYGLVGLQSQYLGLKEVDGGTIHFNEAASLLDEGNSGGGFLRTHH